MSSHLDVIRSVTLCLIVALFVMKCGTEAAVPKKTVNKDASSPPTNIKTSTATVIPNKNCTNTTQEKCNESQKGRIPKTFLTQMYENKTMLMRAFYVVVALTAIVVVYFVVRAWRLRRRRSKSRKYGIITTPGADVEMQPLDEDDDDDDMTLFESNGRPSYRKSDLDC